MVCTKKTMIQTWKQLFNEFYQTWQMKWICVHIHADSKCKYHCLFNVQLWYNIFTKNYLRFTNKKPKFYLYFHTISEIDLISEIFYHDCKRIFCSFFLFIVALCTEYYLKLASSAPAIVGVSVTFYADLFKSDGTRPKIDNIQWVNIVIVHMPNWHCLIAYYASFFVAWIHTLYHISIRQVLSVYLDHSEY